MVFTVSIYITYSIPVILLHVCVAQALLLRPINKIQMQCNFALHHLASDHAATGAPTAHPSRHLPRFWNIRLKRIQQVSFKIAQLAVKREGRKCSLDYYDPSGLSKREVKYFPWPASRHAQSHPLRQRYTRSPNTVWQYRPWRTPFPLGGSEFEILCRYRWFYFLRTSSQLTDDRLVKNVSSCFHYLCNTLDQTISISFFTNLSLSKNGMASPVI